MKNIKQMFTHSFFTFIILIICQVNGEHPGEDTSCLDIHFGKGEHLNDYFKNKTGRYSIPLLLQIKQINEKSLKRQAGKLFPTCTPQTVKPQGYEFKGNDK